MSNSSPLKNCPIPDCCGDGVLVGDDKFVHCDNCDIEMMKVSHWQAFVREGDSPREQSTDGAPSLKSDLDAAYAAIRAVKIRGCECGAVYTDAPKAVVHTDNCPHVDTIQKARGIKVTPQEWAGEPDWAHEPDSVLDPPLKTQPAADDFPKCPRCGRHPSFSDGGYHCSNPDCYLHAVRVGCCLWHEIAKRVGFSKRIERLERDMEVHWHTGLGSSAKGLLNDELPK